MNDLHEKMRERWQDKKKKAYNWPKVIIMLAALAAIFYAMGRLDTASRKSVAPSATITDTLATDTLHTGQQP